MQDYNTQPTPPISQPIVEEYSQRTNHNWLALLLYGVALLAIAFIVVFGGRALYRHYHQTVKTVPANTKALPPQPSASSSNGSSASSGSAAGVSEGFSSTDNNKATGSTSSNNQQVANNNIPNSGPGQVMGIFIGASLAAAGLHYIVQVKKTA